jgi:hypothetical protein
MVAFLYDSLEAAAPALQGCGASIPSTATPKGSLEKNRRRSKSNQPQSGKACEMRLPRTNTSFMYKWAQASGPVINPMWWARYPIGLGHMLTDSERPQPLPSRSPVVITVTATWAPLSPSSPPLPTITAPTAATMQAAALRRQFFDHHLAPTSSAAIAALRSGSVPGLPPQGSYHLSRNACPSGWVDLSERVGLYAGLCGADGARYMASARAPAVKGSGHLVRKGTGGRSSVR